MADGFYISDVKTPDLGQKIKTEKDVLHFKHDKAGFDDRAKAEHLKNFPAEYGAFKAAHPGFKNPFADEEDNGELKLNPGESVGVAKTDPEDDAKAGGKKVKETKPEKVIKDKSGAFNIKKSASDLKKEHTDRDRPVR